MSATLPNADRVAQWLRATLFTTDFRPVELRKYVCHDGQLLDERRNVSRALPEAWPELAARPAGGADEVADKAMAVLVQESVARRQSVLMFLGMKARTVKAAALLAEVLSVEEQPPPEPTEGADSDKYYSRARALADLQAQPGLVAEQLRRTIAHGVAFHNSDLTPDLRHIVESAFRSGAVLVLAATPTVSTGVNMPAWRVIIRDPWIGRKDNPLQPGKCRQMCGRAGRKGMAEKGEAILFSTAGGSAAAMDRLYSMLNGELTPVSSNLLENGMEQALLEVIANGMAATPRDVAQYLHSTLFHTLSQDDPAELAAVNEAVKRKLLSLRDSKLAYYSQAADAAGFWAATDAGKAAALASIPPHRVIDLRRGIEEAMRAMNLETDLHLTYLVIQGDPLGLRNQEEGFFVRVFVNVFRTMPDEQKRAAKALGLAEDDVNVMEMWLMRKAVTEQAKAKRRETLHRARRFLSAKVLFDLIEEVPFTEIVKRCSTPWQGGMERKLVTETQLNAIHETAGPVVGQVHAFCEGMRGAGNGWGRLADLLARFQGRVLSGVQADIVALTDIPGVGAARARQLFKAHLRSPEDVAKATVEQVAKIFEAAAASGRQPAQHNSVLMANARKVVQGAKRLMRERAQELQEEAKAALEAVALRQSQLSSSQAPPMSQAQATPEGVVPPPAVNKEVDVEGGNEPAVAPARPATEAALPAAEASGPEEPAAIQIESGVAERHVPLRDVLRAAAGAALAAFAFDVSRTSAPPPVPLPRLKGEPAAGPGAPAHPHCAGAGGGGQAVVKGCALTLQLAPGASGSDSQVGPTRGEAYYIPLEGAAAWEQTLAFLLPQQRRASGSGTARLITCDLKAQLTGLASALAAEGAEAPRGAEAILASAAGAVGVVDVRIASWMLNPDAGYVADRLPEDKRNSITLLLERCALKENVTELQQRFRGHGARREAVRRAACAMAVWQIQAPQLRLQGLERALITQEMPLVPVLARMEHNGIMLDPSALRKERDELMKTLVEMERMVNTELRRPSGQGFKLDSVDQVRAILFTDAGLKLEVPPVASAGAKPNKPSTRSEVLEALISMLEERVGELIQRGEPSGGEAAQACKRALAVVRAILEHRKIGKLSSSFNNALRLCGPPGASSNRQGAAGPARCRRISGQLLQTCTGTGRLAMDEPNLMCVPKPRRFRVLRTQPGSQDLTQHRDSVANCRRGFVASEGCVLLGADYKQIELRVAAHFSKDDVLLEMFRHAQRDSFRELAAAWLGKPLGEVDDEERAHAKELTYAMIYGAGKVRLAEAMGCSEVEAAAMKESFQERLPQLTAWTKAVVAQCSSAGYVETLSRRRRPLPGLRSRNGKERARAERQAVNTLCQGSAADIAKLAMIAVDRRLAELGAPGPPAGRLLLHIHDELLFEVEAGALPRVAAAVRGAMESAVALAVPLPVKLQVGCSWGELAEWKEPSPVVDGAN